MWRLAATQAVSWGTLYYAPPVLIVPMDDDLGWSRPTIVGAYALATLVSAVAAPAVGRHLDRRDGRALMTAGSALAAALVVAWSQASTPADELRAHTKTLLAGYKVPRSIDFVDPLPLSGTGKVLKRELRARPPARRAPGPEAPSVS